MLLEHRGHAPVVPASADTPMREIMARQVE
jgi:hypothetical protein